MRTANDLGREGNIIHAAMLLTTEAGEIMDTVKKTYAYRKDLDEANIVEEMGDIMWGLALMCRELGVSLEDVMIRNIRKLEARYPEKAFSQERALNRDKAAEEQAMK